MSIRVSNLIEKLEYHYPTNQTRKDACKLLMEMKSLLQEALPYVQQHHSINADMLVLQQKIVEVLQ